MNNLFFYKLEFMWNSNFVKVKVFAKVSTQYKIKTIGKDFLNSEHKLNFAFLKI